jgi:hypothetical protein
VRPFPADAAQRWAVEATPRRASQMCPILAKAVTVRSPQCPHVGECKEWLHHNDGAHVSTLCVISNLTYRTRG